MLTPDLGGVWQGLSLAGVEGASCGGKVCHTRMGNRDGSNHVRRARRRRSSSGAATWKRCVTKDWVETAELMSARGWRVIAADLPGHGDSGQLEVGAYDPSFFSRWVSALVKHVGAATGILVGHSLAGHLAMEALPCLPS